MNFAGTSTLLSRAAFALCALLAAGNGLVPQARAQDATNKLEAVDVQTLPGQQLQLTLRTSGPAPEPLSFTIDNPARISLDLPKTALALPSRRIDVRAGGLDTILAAEANGRTRLVMNLDRLLPYQTKVQGNTIVVSIGSALASAAPAAAAESRPASNRPAASASGAREIRSVDFRRGGDGMGRLIVNLSDPRTPINLRQQGNQIVVDFAGAAVPNRLIRRFDALDFATPVSTFDVMRADDGTRIVISANGDFEQLAYQSDDQYVVEIQPARKAQAAAEEKPTYTGERLTLNFQDIETRVGEQPEHRRQRLGLRQRHAAPAERALGPGARHRAAHQGPRQAPHRQRHHHRAVGRARRAREGRARRPQGHPGTRADALRVPAGQLRQGR